MKLISMYENKRKQSLNCDLISVPFILQLFALETNIVYPDFKYFVFLVGASLEKRVDYSYGFSSVFLKKFFEAPEVTEIVLQPK